MKNSKKNILCATLVIAAFALSSPVFAWGGKGGGGHGKGGGGYSEGGGYRGGYGKCTPSPSPSSASSSKKDNPSGSSGGGNGNVDGNAGSFNGQGESGTSLSNVSAGGAPFDTESMGGMDDHR